MSEFTWIIEKNSKVSKVVNLEYDFAYKLFTISMDIQVSQHG